MMDAITKVNETLNIIYTFLPKEILIIILAGILFLLYETLKDKGNKNAK
jgi:hypothetical protein